MIFNVSLTRPSGVPRPGTLGCRPPKGGQAIGDPAEEHSGSADGLGDGGGAEGLEWSTRRWRHSSHGVGVGDWVGVVTTVLDGSAAGPLADLI